MNCPFGPGIKFLGPRCDTRRTRAWVRRHNLRTRQLASRTAHSAQELRSWARAATHVARAPWFEDIIFEPGSSHRELPIRLRNQVPVPALRRCRTRASLQRALPPGSKTRSWIEDLAQSFSSVTNAPVTYVAARAQEIRAPEWDASATAEAKYDPFGAVPARGRGSPHQNFGEASASSC